MKKLMFCAAVVLGLSTGLMAQDCDVKIGAAPWFSAPLPSVLEVLTGDFPLPSAEKVAQMNQARPGLEAFEWLDYQLAANHPEQVLNYTSSQGMFEGPGQWDRAKVYAGIAHLQAQDFAKAAALLVDVDSCQGTADRLRIAAQYLAKYAGKGDGPLFGHFNGGYSNFLADSLKGTVEEKSVQMGKALEELLYIFRLLGGQDRKLEEMIGDLLLNSPDAFQGRWTAAVAYLRAGEGLHGGDSTQWEKKAIYCLESDRINPKYFNGYRFKKLQRNYAAERDSAERRRTSFAAKESDWLALAHPENEIAKFYAGYSLPAPSLSFLPERTTSPLLAQIVREQERSMQQSVGPNPNANPLNPDIDVSAIKSNTKYNFYAIGLILAVLGAGVFMAWQLRKHSKTR